MLGTLNDCLPHSTQPHGGAAQHRSLRECLFVLPAAGLLWPGWDRAILQCDPMSWVPGLLWLSLPCSWPRGGGDSAPTLAARCWAGASEK